MSRKYQESNKRKNIFVVVGDGDDEDNDMNTEKILAREVLLQRTLTLHQ